MELILKAVDLGKIGINFGSSKGHRQMRRE